MIKPQEYVQWVNFKNIIFFFSLHFFCVGHKVRPWSSIWYSFARDKLLVKSWESLAKNPGHQRESRYCTYLGYLKTREKVSCYCQLWHWYRYSESLFEPFFSSRNSWSLSIPKMINMQVLLKISICYSSNRWWEYSNLTGRGCYLDPMLNSHNYLQGNVRQPEGELTIWSWE